jgi:DNA-binding NarL/FixJ family response regulator
VTPMTAVRPVPSVAVAVLASDALTSEGTIAYLRSCRGVTPVPESEVARADVVLVMTATVSEETLALIERAADDAGDHEVRFVLVGDGIREPQLLRAVTCGLVSVLPRKDATFGRIVTAITDAAEGCGEMPGYAIGWLAARLRSVQEQVLAPIGLTTTGLQAREIDVVRLLADGLDTAEIAAELNYSERTVKNIIHGMLSRLNLRNRSHAVAYAMRSGML